MIRAEIRFDQYDDLTINIDELGASKLEEFLWDSYNARIEHSSTGTYITILGTKVKMMFVSHSPDCWDKEWGWFYTKRDYIAAVIDIVTALADPLGQEVDIIYHGIEQADLEFYLKELK